MSFKICGTGIAIPPKVITNEDLSKILDTSDDWIRTHTGVIERHILNGSLLDLAVEACEKAIEDSGVIEIDLLICSTLQGEYITPSMSPLIAKRLNLTCRHMFDINMACSGFVYALDMADAYILSGKARNVLIVCAEALSRATDWTDRSTCILFGDGAAAVVLRPGEGCVDIQLSSDGNVDLLYMGHVNDNCPFTEKNPVDTVIYMEGKEVYKFAVKAICNDINKILADKNLSYDDIKYFLVHQANKRIIDSAIAKFKQPEEKFPCNIDRYGNTSSATLPLLIDELKKADKLQDGDLLVLSAFGAGLTTGVCLLKW
ncbi:MAG: ketoacyl-ACP synthase III [Oscillospiraceae bacterium]|nr:ketoacyl-ACP synthase III [Oscillospiraceae bacterium]